MYKIISLFHNSSKLLNSFKTRKLTMGSPLRNENLLDELQKNPYYEKYSARIAALQKTAPEEFSQRVESQQVAKGQQTKAKFGSVDTRQFSSVLNPKEKVNNNVVAEEKKLKDIFKVELVEDKESYEIQTIWEEYHKNKEVISATIPKDLYVTIQNQMQQFPVFLFPLPRSQGYEFIMCQSFGHTVHFTPLLAYQVHKENAPECLTIIHYPELSHKGIVLMKGEYDKNVINGQEAQCLANQFQMYYSGKDQNKLKLLETFTQSPDSFKHMDLISELENITLV